NEPGVGEDDGSHFIDWHIGFSEVMETAGYWYTVFDFPPGFPGLPNDPAGTEGRLFWTNPKVHQYIERVVSWGSRVNLHEGDIFHARNFHGEFDSLRHRKIRPLLPASIRNMVITS